MTSLRVTSETNVEDSLAVTQSFCRLMLVNSLVAVPTYLGLFMIAVPFDINAGTLKGLAMTTPVLAFTAAAWVYAMGFLATASDDRREDRDYSAMARRRLVQHKTKLIKLGAVPFLAGILLGTLLLVKAHL